MNLIASSGQLRASLLRWSLVLVPLVVLLGFISGKVSQSGPGNAWFDALAKPATYPPPIAFPIVWTLLYVLMGVALAMVCSARGARGRGLAVAAFVLQFALNLAWSPVFFGAHQMTIGLAVIAAMDFAVLLTIALFWRIRPVAALLLVPYLVWICFATYLNYAFLEANPSLDGAEGPRAVERFEI
ncbi:MULTISPECIES: TspO/MBR family protein [Novosphingobium]|uniref:TspO/MBR family protein n=1 Tax=Novosphingobium sp. ST904 TaxID=1684385 RepID=UPI0006C8BB85|nr:TspO/MBR family protein [Novosphingobium sp. ST904]KPH59527.1 CrtK protein [Novosphingobium sp. ST904]TCM37957.1 TspO/MBR related protein [Novosphingobium sp. ST904]